MKYITLFSNYKRAEADAKDLLSAKRLIDTSDVDIDIPITVFCGLNRRSKC